MRVGREIAAARRSSSTPASSARCRPACSASSPTANPTAATCSDLRHRPNRLRDPYKFDFLTLRTDAAERELERGLIAHIRKFLLELGAGFAFVGQQVPLEVDGEDYSIDLRRAASSSSILKARPFKSEYAGKMNFYLSAVDNRLRHPDDEPSIGLILCKSRSRTVAEYALRDLAKPVGVARYVTRLVGSLPNLRGALPSTRRLEEEMNRIQNERVGDDE